MQSTRDANRDVVLLQSLKFTFKAKVFILIMYGLHKRKNRKSESIAQVGQDMAYDTGNAKESQPVAGKKSGIEGAEILRHRPERLPGISAA